MTRALIQYLLCPGGGQCERAKFFPFPTKMLSRVETMARAEDRIRDTGRLIARYLMLAERGAEFLCQIIAERAEKATPTVAVHSYSRQPPAISILDDNFRRRSTGLEPALLLRREAVFRQNEPVYNPRLQTCLQQADFGQPN